VALGVLALAPAAPAGARAADPEILPPAGRHYGKTYGEWSAARGSADWCTGLYLAFARAAPPTLGLASALGGAG